MKEQDSEVFLDGGMALNVLEAKAVVYDEELDIAVICVAELEANDLGNKNCTLL